MTPAGIGKEDKKIKLVKDVFGFHKFSFWQKFWGEVNEELSCTKRVFDSFDVWYQNNFIFKKIIRLEQKSSKKYYNRYCKDSDFWI